MTSAGTKLQDLFQAARARSIEWNGRTVCTMFEIAPIDPRAVITVDFLRHSAERPQVMVVNTRGARLKLGDRLSQTWNLWADGAPRRRELSVVPDGAGAVSLRFWNGFEDRHGTMHAWTGNSGMLVTEVAENVFRADCSDGWGDVAFDDHVVQFTLQA
jgi:hypothetical protein